MAIPTLQEAKEFLRLEVNYFDNEVEMLLSSAIRQAENITGRNYTVQLVDTYEVMQDDVKQAVLMIVATGFDQRQNNTKDSENESVNAAIFTLRQNSSRPIF